MRGPVGKIHRVKESRGPAPGRTHQSPDLRPNVIKLQTTNLQAVKNLTREHDLNPSARRPM
jgi:hypothetical protein